MEKLLVLDCETLEVEASFQAHLLAVVLSNFTQHAFWVPECEMFLGLAINEAICI